MTNIQKRILTSLIILPLSIFFIIKGGYLLSFFLLLIFLIGIYELNSVFKKKNSIIFLSLILVISLFCIYYLSEVSEYLLFFVISVTISSDIGGYIFGNIFKWKKLTKISPKKTYSGVLGSYFFSIICLIVWMELFYADLPINAQTNTFLKLIIITIIFSTIAQIGDLIISYFKRLDSIKDTGKLLPGHGGIFDRIDGLMFVVIIATIYYHL
tara:strand:- start:509 stop:1144 length:636 start_codon:yes stop_codon:yes gene_type:complete